MTTLDLSTLYAADGTARLARLDEYVATAVAAVPPGADATLTGPAPVWLYLRVAHALHGRCRRLVYTSPVSGDVPIFDHTP
ncbi:MAG: hypothetical protein GX230_03930 [Lentisphaerae bacterium]|nr:hypothetical protein [Lentisphaerota bacterium]